jgi:hypothetical protein
VLAAVAATAAAPVGLRAADELFVASDRCLACHNGLVGPDGRDVSIGFDWRASMMANSFRDPYWQAAVRREVMDHPDAAAAIEDECAICHLPMARHEAHRAGNEAAVFAHLPASRPPQARATALARDGVSCALCHQITAERFGTPDSFTGGFVVAVGEPTDARAVFGPYDVVAGLAEVMRSATGFTPTQSTHIQKSELCATCHTLFTHTRGPAGEVIATLPEQVPYLEWKHSDYVEMQSCQDCHMPVLTQPTPIASVAGEPREDFSRHVFRGGNFFVPRMLNLQRVELGVSALPQELETMIQRTTAHLQTEAATLAIEAVRLEGGTLTADVVVSNLAGHKLPTAYPSRRAWLHVTLHDADGALVFESGALTPDGAIVGNANDEDPRQYEPHHEEISNPTEVQIYEPIMVTADGEVTTGLLSAVRYAKDNRILPLGFDKATAAADIAVQGRALEDDDFVDGADRVRYRVLVGDAAGPYRITAALVYQPIGFRWAHNLGDYDVPEPKRFIRAYETLSAESALVLAATTVTTATTTAGSPAP